MHPSQPFGFLRLIASDSKVISALLALACVLAVGIPVAAGLVRAAQGQTQGSGAAQKGGISGSWQGRMRTPDGHNLRVVLKIAKDEKGGLSATLYNLDQNGPPMAGSLVSFERGTLRFVNDFPRLTYEGKMSADGNSISGTVTQNGSSPLVLERATPETEWATPASPPRILPMAPDAKPGVEVATIKPTQPGTRWQRRSSRPGRARSSDDGALRLSNRSTYPESS
jgi:hypothetical protein